MKRSIITALVVLNAATFGYFLYVEPSLAGTGEQARVEAYAEPPSAEVRERYPERVERVVDADTFVLASRYAYGLELRVRLDGLDAPEKGHRADCDRERRKQDEGENLVKAALAESGGRVLLSDVSWDKYGGRINATVWLPDGRNLNEMLIRRGLAKQYNGGGPRPTWCF